MATQDDLKRMAGEKAVEFVPENEYIGIGTGSTVNYFIKALAASGKSKARSAAPKLPPRCWSNTKSPKLPCPTSSAWRCISTVPTKSTTACK